MMEKENILKHFGNTLEKKLAGFKDGNTVFFFPDTAPMGTSESPFSQSVLLTEAFARATLFPPATTLEKCSAKTPATTSLPSK